MDTETETEGESQNETEDEHVEYEESPRKRLNSSFESVGVSPVNLHSLPPHSRVNRAKEKLKTVMSKFEESISTVYNFPMEELKDSEPSNNDKRETIDKKADEFDKLCTAIKEKLLISSYPEKVQLLTLAPDSWSREYCSKYFDVSEYLVRKARDLKRDSGILATPLPKKGKTIPQEHIIDIENFYKSDENSRQMPGKKDCVSIRKNVHEQKRLVLCNLRELYAAFKMQNPDIKVGFSKFCALRPKSCIIAGKSGTHSVCVCSIHQNAVLLVDAIQWDITYKDLVNKVVCDSTNRICMMHRCENCPGVEALKVFVKEKLKDFDEEEEFHYMQWDTTDRASLQTITTNCNDYVDTLCKDIDELTKHSFVTKCQAKFLKAKKESLLPNEAIVLGDFAENYQFLIQDEIQSYHWSKEYCTLHPVVVYYQSEGTLKHKSFCFISNDNTHDTNFVYKVQTLVVEYLKENLPRISKLYYFSDGCAGQYKNYKNFMNLCHHQEDFGIDAEWIFFATSHGKSPCDGIGGFVKRHVAKRSLQRPLKNQILDYEAMLDLCVTELKDIHFVGISQEEMKVVREELKNVLMLVILFQEQEKAIILYLNPSRKSLTS
ncbi:uncharacterized protein [Clytia hemisphaerica]|uniref:uncharacterized protein n=1 Tax=Clytia hemisphaerica TaxID=252671 RepID=UPI0034D7B58A